MKLVSSIDVIRRDKQPSLSQWIRVKSALLFDKGFTPVKFDGTVDGAPVFAFVSNSRWMAICDQPFCDGAEYVDSESRIFFCMKCSNGQTGKARPVSFPKNWSEIEEALLERPMMPILGSDKPVMTFNSRPLFPALRRDWVPEALKGHPGLIGRVQVDAYDETPAILRARNDEVLHAGNI